MEQKIENRILNLNGEFLLEEVAEKANITRESAMKYLSLLESSKKTRTGITEDRPWEKTYIIQ